MSDFVHLHVHSHYSLLDALPKVNELVKAAKAGKFSALALTDHGNLYGAIEFYEACLAAGIKPILGVEVYTTPYNLDDKNIAEHKQHHLILLVKNYTGYRNLLKLVTFSYLEGMKDKPLVDRARLREFHEGLIALSGCIEGEIPTILHKEGNVEKATKVALEMQEIFGKENFYLELNDLPALEGQMELNTLLIKLGKENNIPLVVTRDAHYLKTDEAEAQDILTCIRDGQTLDEPNRPTMQNIDYSFTTAKEIISRFKHCPEAIANTLKIADSVDLKLELNKWHFPALEIPNGKTADAHLRELVYEKLPKLMEITDDVKKRIEYELDIITGKGYSPYFLVVADYVDYARTHGIIETTRGSAAGSLVSYAMGIVNVNPLFFKLPFERFLNPFRPSPPDVDADFADDRRDEMIAYVTNKYGADKVAQIVTFGTMAARGSIRDVGRALGYSYSFCDQVSKLIPFGAQGFQMTIAKAITLVPELKELSLKNDQVKRLLDLAQKIEGCARHTSIHAAGVVISPTPLTDFTPLQRESGGENIVTQYEFHDVESAGLLKMDFLGLRNLSILAHAMEIVEKTTGQKIDIYNLQPWDDKKTYEMLARGETIGVFQLSSSGMTRYLKELRPSSILDIMAMVALFRPGPMESIPDYIRRKNNPELIDYLDPRMKDYLDQSLGLIVYQDDVLLTAINLAGYNWEEADKFRKAMGKKIPEEMAKQKEKFFKGCREFGKLPDLKIHRLWELIEPFAAYGFNKAHAASYGVVAYQTAYLKANFPVQYMTAVLISESGDIDKVPAIIHECGRMGIKVLPPSINESFRNFAMIQSTQPDLSPTLSSAEERETRSSPPQRRGQGEVPAHIRFGLNGIKNLGEHIAGEIYRERKENGKYTSLSNLLDRVHDKDLNKKSLESLIKCGALDEFGYDRGVLMGNSENILSYVREHQEKNITSKNQNSLFSGSSIDVASRLRLLPFNNATADDKLHWEKDLLGLYVSSHPFAKFQRELEGVLTLVNDLPGVGRKQWVVVGGVIDSMKKKITRAGKSMMFVTIQDVTGSLELLVFPKTYETTKDVWKEGRMVCVVGRSGDEEGDDKLFVERVYEITDDNFRLLKSQMAGIGSANVGLKNESRILPSIPSAVAEGRSQSHSSTVEGAGGGLEIFEITVSSELLKNKADAIKGILRKHPGSKQVYLKVGEKKIKTSFSVDVDGDLKSELKKVIG